MPRLSILLDGHLMVAGGQATALGVDAATSERLVEGRWLPYIPATALRGAVRLQLEALLRGAGGDATGPYPHDEIEEGGDPRSPRPESRLDPVARLFGFSGPRGERGGSREGTVRFSDALPVDPSRARACLTVRAGVELDDDSGSAADKKLFFRQVAETASEPLELLATLDLPPDLDHKDLAALRAAVETTDAIGGGKSNGGGRVQIRWLDGEEKAEHQVAGNPEGATRARLTLTLLEPAHLGDGGPRGNHHATRTYIPGATVRGALAWALLRGRLVAAEDPAFQALFCGDVSFGDALPQAPERAEPVVHPATLRQRRGSAGALRRDVLVSELARDRANGILAAGGLYLRADDGDERFDPLPSRPAPGLLRRTRTRLAIDRDTGTAAEGRLFSIEQIEAWRSDESDGEPVRFVSWIEGLDPADRASARLLARVAEIPVFVGAGRNHGMGRVALDLRFESGAPDLATAKKQVQSFADAVDRRTRQLIERAGGDAEERAEGETVPLVLVATSDFVPVNEEGHPLAELKPAAPSLRRLYLSTGRAGGFDQRPEKERPGPLKPLLPAVGAGSVFVYEVERRDLGELLRTALPALRRGVGRSTESGCGRFTLFEDRSNEEEEHDR